jgi:CarD family transcriptional regulator
MTKSKKPEFRPNDFVVYPAHGVGKILSIEEQEIAGFSWSCSSSPSRRTR